MNNIGNTLGAVNLPLQPSAANALSRPTESGSGSFKEMLVNSIKEVNSMQHEADQAVQALFTGEDVNPAEVMTAVQKADLAFRMTMQLRNKAMDVYREIKEIHI